VLNPRQSAKSGHQNCESYNIPNQRRLRFAPGVSEIEDQGEVSIVHRNTGDVDEARNSFLWKIIQISPPTRLAACGGVLFFKPWILQKAALIWKLGISKGEV
jgi:hypothetical protein